MTAIVEPLSAADIARQRLKAGRWIQLILGVLCMVMIANLQYGWTLFVDPMIEKYHWSLTAVQWAFTIFVQTETWLVPIEGYLADRFGPRAVTIIGGLLVAAGWSINSVAGSLPLLYVGQAIGGIGAGAVYGTCVGNALKWFPERRGLAAGITAAGFGAGAAATVLPITWMLKSSGYEATFLYFGLGQGLVVIVLGFLLAKPDAATVAALPKPTAQPVERKQFEWQEILRTPVFWVMYLMFVCMAAGGLAVTANLKQIAASFGVAKTTVSFFGLAPTAITFALFLDRITNGVTRPFFGWVSDKIGRENAMFLAFGIEAIGILLLSQLGHNPVAFVVLSGLVFFAWGEIYSLFPSTCADTYGWKFASTNAGALYTAKGLGGFFPPIAAAIATASWGNWQVVFVIAAVLSGSAAILALAVLKPMRRRFLAQTALPKTNVAASSEKAS
jgi:OFA family oxalate/formate antiporter-like MFS transporter